MPLSARSENVSDLLFGQLSALATCLCEAIDPVCRCDVVIGDQHYSLTGPEYKCKDACGEAWVRVVSIEPSGTQQRVSFGGQECNVALRLTLEVGVLRCMPVPSSGKAPDEAVMAGLASQHTRDLVGAQEAILCCEHFDGIRLQNYVPVTDGNLMGGFWQVGATF